MKSLFKFVSFSFVLAVFALTGCDNTTTSPTADTTPAESAPAKPRVGLVMKTLTNPFFVEMEKGARKAEKEFDINLIVKTAAQETSIQQQIAIVDDMIREKLDAIVIAPGDSVELIPVLKKAQDAGIVVINIDNQLSPEFSEKTGLKNVPFISVDNESSAYESAKYIADQITAPAKAFIMEGIQGALNAEQRKNGAIKAFTENTNIEIVETDTANWKIDDAKLLMKSWLDKHPDVKLVFAANDMMAFGILNALKEADRSDVLVASYDALNQAKQAIREGTLQATMDQLPAEQGYQGVVFALRGLKGESLPATHFVSTRLITTENISTL